MKSRPRAVPALPGHFEQVSALGGGGQAITLAAHDIRTNRAVVLKVLELSAIRDWKAFDRFERESAVLRSLDHPGIPAYLEHTMDEARGHYRLVMERIEGSSLAEDLAKGHRRTEAQLLALLSQLLDVLEYLHGLHPAVVHRDIKPSNVVIGPDGRAALVDFGGVAKVFQPKGSTTVVGTFGYMAPEQLHGRVTPGCDLYALGATLAALAAGEDAADLPRRGLEVELDKAISPGPLRQVLQALLRADPLRRPSSVAEVRALLARIEKGSSVEPEPEAPSLPARREPTEVARSEPDEQPPLRGLSSLPMAWQRLSPGRRRTAHVYIWTVLGLSVVTTSPGIFIWGLLLFPGVIGLLYGLGPENE